jgi:hypothetical protein
LNSRAASTGDGSGHTRAMFQEFVGSVDDRFSRFNCDIALYKLEGWTGGKDGFD